MERKIERRKASELLNLLDGYVHGGVSRRQFLDRAQKFTVGGVTAMALFEMLRPNYAWAIQVPPGFPVVTAPKDPAQPAGNAAM